MAAARAPSGRSSRRSRRRREWAYGASDEEGPLYGGIRYESRIAGGECFAIFDGTALAERERQPIRLEDPELRAVADAFGLRPF